MDSQRERAKKKYQVNKEKGRILILKMRSFGSVENTSLKKKSARTEAGLHGIQGKKCVES